MSSDARDWWQRSQEPEKEPEDQESQATRQHPVERGRPADQGYQDPQATQLNPAGQDYQNPQATQRNPANQGYQDSQATRQYPVERGRPADPGQGSPPDQGRAADRQAAADQWYTGGQGGAADPRYPGGQGGTADQRYAGGQGFPAAPSFSPSQGARADEGFSAGQGYPSGQGFPSGQGSAGQGSAGQGSAGQGFAAGAGYQQDQAGQGYQNPRGTQDYPAGPGFPEAQNYQGAPAPRARRRRRRWPWITLIVIIVLLVGGDRAANAFAEDQMASQFASSLALSGKPHVTIQGFPFLTQLAARDFHQVDINASNETAGPGGQLEIKSLTATLHGMHIKSSKSTEIDDFSASALITFSALAHAGNIPGGITLSADGPNRVKAHVDLDVISGDVVLQVTQVGDSKINIKLIDANGLPTDLLGDLVNFTVSIPKLPAGVKIQKISVTSEGLRLTATGHNTTLSQ
jgi:LmeA-like phospholipid-binding